MKAEDTEMAIACDWLDAKGFDGCYFHVPNEGKRSPRTGKRLKRIGMRRGVPDMHVIRRTPRGAPGIVWEMKKPGGPKPTKHQLAWLEHYENEGWVTGWGPAFDFIELVEETYGV